MCVAVPLRVLQRIDADRALVEQRDMAREVNIRLVPDVMEGEYVLVNLGVAVQKLSQEEAEGILDLWDQIALSLVHEDVGEMGRQNG
jgi:hydrogenase expression/formation protein HypC